MIKNIDLWIWSYIRRVYKLKKVKKEYPKPPQSILFTICDHYEPYWNHADDSTAYKRVANWVESYQSIAEKHFDSSGANPKHCFFYPAEEYRKELLDMIANICRNGFGEVDIHLHHDNDTSDNLRQTLIDFKLRLSQDHGLLSSDKKTSDIKYGFIHGNWALDNSRPDGRWCGVNNEIDILQETGCYADFTMPSAPDVTQTSTVNSIYYAIDNPDKPKSHNSGITAKAGLQNDNGLMCIQGPLTFNLSSRKFAIFPRIENGCISHDSPSTNARVKSWINQCVHVDGRSDVAFIKLHTHGTQENNMDFFFNKNGLDILYSQLEEQCNRLNAKLYYVSARQMYNVVKGLEDDQKSTVDDTLDMYLRIFP